MRPASRSAWGLRLTPPTPETVIVTVLVEPVRDRLASHRGVDQPHPEEDRDLQNYRQKDDWDNLTHEVGILPFLNPA